MTNSTQNDREPGVSCTKRPSLSNILGQILAFLAIRNPLQPTLKPIPIKANRLHTRKNQRGNVFAMLFAAVALTGVLAAVGMQTLTGPVTTITRVTQKNIAETNLLMNAKIIANAVPLNGTAGSIDADPIKEAHAFVPAGGGETAPANGGFLPTDLGLALTDPWGTKYGYCVWDHGADTGGTNYIPGDDGTPEEISIQPLIAVISAGPDKVFQTGCPTFTSGVMSTQKASGSDDLVQEFTYDGASAAANGLWTLDSPGGAVAQLKAADNSIKASIDRSSGVANFLGVTTDALVAKDKVVAMDGGLKLDTSVNVTDCTAAEAGSMRYDATNKKVEVCNGAAWIAMGGDLWATDNTNIWRATGNVGINDTTPTAALDVTGTFNATGAATLGGTLGVTGATTLTSTLNVGNNTDIDGTLNADGATTLGSTLNVTGNTDLGGTLDVTGNTGLGGTLGVTGAADLDSTLDVAGAATLDSTLNVTGATILSDTLDVTEAAVFADTMEVAGAVNFLTTLNVAGNTAIDSTTLFVDAADKEVGIGTATPAAKLDVQGGIKLGVHTPGCAAGGANNGTIQYDNSTKKMEICVDGNWNGVSSIEKLDDVGDVYVEEAGTANDNDILAWNSADARWEAKNISLLGPAAVNPAGQNGSVQYKDGSDLDADAANFHWDDTNHRLGVGTNSPSDTLTVTGTVGVTGNSSLTGTLTVSGDATFDTNTLFVDATNNGVGIGTTTPYAKLDVNGGIKLGNTSTCAAGGANNGTMRWNTNQLQVCVSGTWSAVSTSSGGGMAGSAPDAIDCGVTGVKRVLYLQTTTATEYRYGFIAGDTGIGMLVTYAVADGTHVATSNTAGWSNATGCDGKDFATLTSENRAFYLIGGAGLSGLVTGAAGSNNEVQFRNTGNGAFDSQSTFVYDKATGRLGVGTASPQRPIHIASTNATLILENTGAAVDAKKKFVSSGGGLLSFGTFSDDMSTTWTNMVISGGGAVGINTATPHASAKLEVASSAAGFLPPRMADPSSAISSPAAGLIAYNTTSNKLMVYNNSTWIALGSVDDGDKGDITVSGNGATWTIDANAVTTAKINDGAVTTSKIGDAQVTSVKIADDAVTTAKIGNNQVTTAKINDGAVTTNKIGDAQVTSLKINDGAVTTAKVGDDQVTFAKMQNIATNRLLGRVTAGSGDVEELTIGSGLTITGTTISVATGSGVGDVVGPASATDNAIARYDGTTGKLIQNSGVTIGDAGETNITSASANALTVGPNGTTNPVLQVDGSTASSATGIKVTGAAAGSGVTLGVISSNTDENLIITSKGGGSVISLRPGNSQTLGLSTASSAFTPTANAAAATVRFRFTGAADSNLTADTESPSVYFNSGQTRQHIAAAGAYAVQRDFRITPSTHSFDAADTITKAAALSVDGAPLGGTNATIITSTAIDVPARVLTNVTNGYGLDITQPTGATSNNSAAYFHGDAANSVNVILENDSTTSDKSELFFVNGTSAGGWGIGTDYAGDKGDNFYIWGGGSGASRMYINAAGTVAIGGNHTSPSASALLDLSSSSRGFLPPRMGDPTTAISSPAEGLLAYNTTTHKLMIRNNTTWSEVGAGSAVASGAAGYIQFSNGSGNLASSGTSAGQQFFWDNTNYRLGIGLTAPTQALDVVGKITTNSMIMKVVTGASAPSNGSGGIWSTSGSNVFLTTSTNKLGIGTNAPATALEVAGPRIRVTNATDPGIELSNGSGVVGYLFYDTTGGDYIGLRHASANPQLVLKNTGNVGIGTTSPGEKLHVVGTVKTDTADAAKAVIMRNSTNGGEWSFRLQGNGTTANNLNVDYGVSNFMTVASSGNVGIGTNTPGSRLDVKQVGTSDDNIRLVDDNTVNYWGMSFNNSTLTFRYNTTDRVSVANSGNMTVVGAGTTCVIGSGTGATNCTSDVRLKTDIKPIENALSKLLAIDGVTFEWKDPEKTKGPHLGVIAQAVEKVFPEAVIEVDDKALGKAKAVDYAVLVAPIIEAIKEIKHALDDLVGKVTELFDIVGKLKVEIAELKAENAELKNQNTDIIKRLEALEAKEQ